MQLYERMPSRYPILLVHQVRLEMLLDIKGMGKVEDWEEVPYINYATLVKKKKKSFEQLPPSLSQDIQFRIRTC